MPETNHTQEPLRGDCPSATVRRPENDRAALRQCLQPLALLAAGLAVCFALPLRDLFRFAWHSDLYSHIYIIPFAIGYLLWLRRKEWTLGSPPARIAASVFTFIGVALLAGYWIGRFCGWQPGIQDRLCLLTLSFVSLFAAGCAWLMGSHNLRVNAYPLAFLVFLAPLPVALEQILESFLQHASADASYALLRISGMSVYRVGLVFMLPGFTFEVAPECSGIHSTLVLFMISLIAGYFFLRHTWTRIVLVAGVIILGVLRNAARIFILAQLCVRVDPKIIDSPLHHSGGPWFFLASLVPLFLLIWLLRRIELRSSK